MLFGISLGGVDPLVAIALSIAMAIGGWWVRSLSGGGGSGPTPTKPNDLGELIRGVLKEVLATHAAPLAPQIETAVVAPPETSKGPLRDVAGRLAELLRPINEDMATLESKPHDAPVDPVVAGRLVSRIQTAWPLVQIVLRASGVNVPALPISPVQLVKVATTVNPFDGFSPEEAKAIAEALRAIVAGRLGSPLAVATNSQLAS